MDKLKEKLGPNAKFVFWGVLALVVLGSVGVWWTATGTLMTEAESRTRSIEGKYSSLTQVRGTASDHPNPHSHVKMEEVVEIAKQDVLGAWKKQFNYQEGILIWPDLNAAGTTDFQDAFEKYLPIETNIAYPTDEANEEVQTLRKRYLEYIEETLPGLAETVGAKWTADFKSDATSMMGGSGMGGIEDQGEDESMEMSMMPSTVAAESDTLVNWSSGSQSELLDAMFPWRSKEVPSTIDILYSQEDLWVVKGLLDIVASVNGDAKKPFQATIREILEIQIGKAVAGRVGSISGVSSSDPSMGTGDFGGEDYGSMSEDYSSMDMSGGGASMMIASPDPADKRYVNLSYEPIDGSTLRSAMAGASPDNAFINVAKRLPVKLRLQMDQRKLPDLLAACANAKLMVEVRQVRINVSGSSAGGMGGMAMMSMGMENESSMMPGQITANEYPYDLPVEVYGVIYIYNPPDGEKLGVEQVDSENPSTVDASAPPAPTSAPAAAAELPPSEGTAPPAAAGTNGTEVDTSAPQTTEPVAPSPAAQPNTNVTPDAAAAP